MLEKSQIKTAWQVMEIVPAVMRIVTAELRQTKQAIVPNQLGVLFMLANCPSNLSELAEQHSVSLPTMSSTISKMVKQGWVQRTRDKNDRRMLLIEITPEGWAVMEQIGIQVLSRIAELLAPLAEEEQQTLSDGLAVLRQAFAVVVQPFPINFGE